MGKIPASGFALDNVRVKVKRPNAGVAGNCGPECISYLACLEKTSGDEVACKSARDALVKCMASAQSTVITSRHKPPVNYHLQKVRPPCPSNLLRARRRDPQSRLAQTPGTAVRSPWAPAALSRVSAFPVCTVHQRVQEMRRGTHLVLGSAVPRAALTTRRLVRMRTHRSHDVVAMFGATMMTA